MPPIDEPSFGVADKVGTISQGDSAWVESPVCPTLADVHAVHTANTLARMRTAHARGADHRMDGAFVGAMETGFAGCRDWLSKESGSMCEDKDRERER